MNTETEANPVAEDNGDFQQTMADVEAANPPEAEAEADEPETGEAEPEDDEDEIEKLLKAGDGEETPQTVEVEYDGKTYNIPPELKDALLRQSDYTKKTMDLAEKRKAVEAVTAEAEELRNLSAERIEASFAMRSIQEQIKQIEAIPVEGLSQDEINAYRMDLQELRNQAAQVDAYGRQLTQRESETRSQQFAKAQGEAIEQAKLRVPNFETRRADLESLAVSMGSTPESVQSIADPAVWEILHLADIGKRAIEQRTKAARIKSAQQAQPAHEVGGKAGGGKSPESMSPAEMAKFLGYS